jgi:hypothetical protein
VRLATLKDEAVAILYIVRLKRVICFFIGAVEQVIYSVLSMNRRMSYYLPPQKLSWRRDGCVHKLRTKLSEGSNFR